MSDWTSKDSTDLYQIENWAKGYFNIDPNGNMIVIPEPEKPEAQINFMEVIKEIQSENISLPVIVRFNDILYSQVEKLNKTFASVIEESNYEGSYRGVYPVKVNQMREVVEDIVEAGKPFHYGLEAGSKAELLAILAQDLTPDSLYILNGYKDLETFRLALIGRKVEKKVLVVIEKFSELIQFVELAEQMQVSPLIGLRVKISTKGHGKWANSGGEKAKFGLTVAEILNSINYLKRKNMLDCFKLLHFHIGSQISDIFTIKNAIDESARIYTELIKLGCNIDYLDVGGGLAIDYDGSSSTEHSSKNYTLEEYVNDIVYGVKQVCDMAKVKHPNIVTESGRWITAHHSCLITKVVDKINTTFTDFSTDKTEDENFLVTNIRECLNELTNENCHAIYNEAQQIKENAINAFKLGMLSISERAKVETLYWQTLETIKEYLQGWEPSEVPLELLKLENQLSTQYLCNFSVFQSIADLWAIDQILPIMPIHRLDEKPGKRCSLVDITCDSDGKVDQFVTDSDDQKTIMLHHLKDKEDYYIGIFLTGAYQDVMGDNHNLFGRLNEVHIFIDEDDQTNFYVEETIQGAPCDNVLQTMQYNPELLAARVKKLVDSKVKKGKIKPREGVKHIDFYEKCLKGYTYLNR